MDRLTLFNQFQNDKRGFINALYGSSPTPGQVRDGENTWNFYKRISGGGTTGGGTNTGGGTSTSNINSEGPLRTIGKSATGLLGTIVKSQMGDDFNNRYGVMSKTLEILNQKGLNFQGLMSGINLIQDQIIDQFKIETDLRKQINSQTTLTGQLSEDLRKSMIESSINAAKFGVSLSDIGDLFTNLVSESGKFQMINKQTIDRAAPFVSVFGDSMTELGKTIATFERVGIGANDTIDKLDEAGRKSVSLGLNGRKVISEITTNIEKLNQYGFQKGIDGLASMVRKSIEFKVSMEKVFDLAEKVMNPEGALDLAANLQVLGGAIGDFGDPLRMMYDATNNVEGLQDALIGAAGSLATYNQEQGRFEITGVNLRRAKAMADAMGMSLQDLSKTAIATAQRTAAAGDLMRSGLQLEDKDREFLTNLSNMEGGEMVIKVPESIAQKLGVPTQIALDKLDKKTADALLANQKEFEKMSTEDMAMEQLSDIKKISRDLDVITAYARVRGAQLISGLGKGVGEEIGISGFIKSLSNELSGLSKKARGDVKPNFEETVKGKTTSTVETIKKNPVVEKIRGAISSVKTTDNEKNINRKNIQENNNNNDISSLSKDEISEAVANGYVKGYSMVSQSNRKKDERINLTYSSIDRNGYLDQG